MQLLFALGLTATLLATPQRPEAAHMSAVQKGAPTTVAQATEAEMLRFCLTSQPEKTYLVTRVVDGDTIHITRNGEREKLRLLSVDTEEKSNGGNNSSATKPSTRYGEQCTGWAQGFFSPRLPDDPPVEVGLVFPEGTEARDPYGRLLCHVVTAEGIDFNLLLVRRGMSPYFNKYGNSKIAHTRFVEAQQLARKEQLGIWNEGTNRNGKKRPYAKLLPWWTSRATAMADFRMNEEVNPLRFVQADNPEALEKAFAAKSGRVTAMGLVFKIYDEDDGSQSVLMRSGDKTRSLRVIVPADQVAAMKAVDLEGSMEEFRQNYLLVEGRLVKGPRGFQLIEAKATDWRRAGPEPKLP